MYNTYNPYFNGLFPQATPIQQNIQQVQKSAQFYNVDSAQDLDGIRPVLNMLYVGFNSKKKEIYVKQLTNDGLISVETYNLADNKKERSDFEIILEKINNIENQITGKGVANVPNNTANDATGASNANIGQAQ